MKKLYFVDYIRNDMVLSQYGQATFDPEKAKMLFEEAVHAYSLDDFYTGVETWVKDFDNNHLFLRTVTLPKAGM